MSELVILTQPKETGEGPLPQLRDEASFFEGCSRMMAGICSETSMGGRKEEGLVEWKERCTGLLLPGDWPCDLRVITYLSWTIVAPSNVAVRILLV